jgi:Xaa-Pro aminopeptidase
MSQKMASIRIEENEHLERQQNLLDSASSRQLSGVVLFDPHYILYYTGFAFVPTERPMALLQNSKGETRLFVPRLELEHAEANAYVDRVVCYLEYPDEIHPMEVLHEHLQEMGITGKTGSDNDGYPWILGYRGPRLSELIQGPIERMLEPIEDQMMTKSEAELGLLRESARWGHLAHILLQRYTAVGRTETEVSQRATDEATRMMLDTIGPIYRAQSPFSEGASAGYRGQIGRNAAIPHSLSANIVFQEGDVLVTGAGAPVWGYHSELERTMIIGEPSNEQMQYFQHMLALQDLAFEKIQPGVRCSDVDQAVRSYFSDHGLQPYWKHHTGHAIGLRYHEGPFLDIGDQTEIAPGMVFTVEPGLYIPAVGGFRHSDTVLVTESGIEFLTYYPRELENLIIPA